MDMCAGALQIFIRFLEIHKEFEIATEIRLFAPFRQCILRR